MANRKNSPHLTLNERQTIEEELNEEHNPQLNDVAKKVNKDPRTVSKEVKARRRKRDLSEKREKFNKKYEGDCQYLRRWQFVCNGCPFNKRCFRDHFYYDAKTAQEEYETTLVTAREGIDATRAEIEQLDKIVKAGAEKKQSIYAIKECNKKDIKKSARTLYYYISRGVLSTDPVKLHNAVKMKPRAKKYAYKKTREENRELSSRNYLAYQRFLATNDVKNIVQIDTVEGKRAKGKVILTIHFVNQHLMLMRLLEEKTADAVSKVFDDLEKLLGAEKYHEMFGVILTDRGNEFMNISQIESSTINLSAKKTNLFFCDAYESSQKGAIESNHRMIRYAIPKGSSMDFLNDELLNRLEVNIANYCRKDLGGLSPIDTFMARFGKETAELLGLKKIDPNTVNLGAEIFVKSNF